jgi:transcriptional regulator GlxA family with amidase domain
MELSVLRVMVTSLGTIARLYGNCLLYYNLTQQYLALRGRTMNPKVRVAISFVDDNLHRDIYVAEVAHLVTLSRSRFSHLFKSEVGMPLIQYLKKARMEKARRILRTSFAPVKAVAAEVGYNDPTHFEREFKKAYGSTPLQYRANWLARLGQKKSARENRTIR